MVYSEDPDKISQGAAEFAKALLTCKWLWL